MTKPLKAPDRLFDDYFFGYSSKENAGGYFLSLPFYIGIFAEEIGRRKNDPLDFDHYSDMINVETQEAAISSVSLAMNYIMTYYFKKLLPEFKMKEDLHKKLETAKNTLKTFFIV